MKGITMLPVSIMLKNFGKLVDQNSPAILTALSVTGTISTAVLTARATWQSYQILELEANRDAYQPKQEIPLKGKILLVWKPFLPAVLTGAATVACVLAANNISTKRQTALATAASLAQTAFGEYKDEVLEQLGKTKEEKVRDGVAAKHIATVDTSDIIETASGNSICFDSLSGRTFTSNMESIRKAVNDVNYTITHEGYASLNDFYYSLNLEAISVGNELGWNNDHLVDVHFTSGLDSQGRPVLHVAHNNIPRSKYDRHF